MLLLTHWTLASGRGVSPLRGDGVKQDKTKRIHKKALRGKFPLRGTEKARMSQAKEGLHSPPSPHSRSNVSINATTTTTSIIIITSTEKNFKFYMATNDDRIIAAETSTTRRRNSRDGALLERVGGGDGEP